MGTFRIQTKLVQTQPPGIIVVGASTLLQVINTFPSTGGIQWQMPNSGSIILVPDDGGIFLDGSVSPISINSLPSGFNVVNASLVSHNSKTGDSSATWRLRIGATTSPLPDVNSFAYPSPIALNSLFATLFGANLTVTATSALVGDLFSIQGTYQIISGSFVVKNLTHPDFGGTLALPGDVLQITSNDPSNDLTKIMQLFYYSFPIPFPFIYQCPNVLIVQLPCPDGTVPQPCTSGGLPFIQIPQFTCPGDGSIPIISFTQQPIICCGQQQPQPPGPLSFTSTLFSGTGFLGSLQILCPNFHGVYQINPGQTKDTVYVNAATGSTTQDIARPLPFFKTGFLGG